MNFINRQRLRVYPFLFLVTLWVITGVNFLLRDGWYGGFGGFISYDFLSYYAGGKLYWTDISNLYNLGALAELQSQIVGIPKTGMNYFPYPPFSALLYGLFSFLPYSLSFYVWTLISVLCILASAILTMRYLIPLSLKQWGVTTIYLLTIILSFYPTLFGLQNGQNHAHSLLFVTAITILSLTKHEYLTGTVAALLLYKPQLLPGWLFLWLLLGRKRTLFSFVVTGMLLASTAILHTGIASYIAWLGFFKENTGVYTWGGPWEVSSIALVSRIAAPVLNASAIPLVLSILSLAGLMVGMLILARKKPEHYIYYLHALVILVPFLVIPHLMFYDLVLLIPFFVIWSNTSRSRWMLYTVLSVYFAGIILPILSEAIDFPIMGLIPLLLTVSMIYPLAKQQFRILDSSDRQPD
jgi:hypothetical protein